MRAAGWVGLLAIGCGPRLAAVEDGEWLPGGGATNTFTLGTNAFLRPADLLTPEHDSLFYAGNSFFSAAWVEAPASTENRDGLGPIFNARSCSACHARDGRAAPPEDGQGPMIGLLFRISGPDGQPDPVYGGQLQDLGNPGVPAEVRPVATWAERAGTFADGEPWSLGVPDYRFEDPAYGPLDPALQVSPRIAPQMIGLGLLEAIPEDALVARADPDDADGDGISGRVQRSIDAETGALAMGRFGWKGDAPTVLHQVAGAFAGDLGITSTLVPTDDCTPAQEACATALDGGDPELDPDVLARVALYSRALAVPVRRSWEDPEVLRGKWLFSRLGCDACHTPSHTTGPFPPLPELEGQAIWPYTDLLLHDMGPDLADDRPLGEASGTEWKTPPLWGLGLIPDVNGHSRYLHDGRARNLEEAVLWHGGEAEEARDAYTELDAGDRAAVLTFLADL
ncbi:MAG: di-heme oxidoredictase family protein [Myxococcota bacterium]